MTKAKRKGISYKSLRAGDVIRIPVGKGRYAIGQIVVPGAEFYLCVFLPLLSEHKSLVVAKVDDLKPAVCVLTTDAPVYHGRWTKLGNCPLHLKIPMPIFKVELYGKGMVLVDIDDKVIRKASTKDEERFPWRTNFGEKNIEEAISALQANRKLPEDLAQMSVSDIRRVSRAAKHDRRS